jgi:hypothetical protein
MCPAFDDLWGTHMSGGGYHERPLRCVHTCAACVPQTGVCASSTSARASPCLRTARGGWLVDALRPCCGHNMDPCKHRFAAGLLCTTHQCTPSTGSWTPRRDRVDAPYMQVFIPGPCPAADPAPVLQGALPPRQQSTSGECRAVFILQGRHGRCGLAS